LRQLLKAGATALRDRLWGSLESELAGLTELQLAVLEVMVKRGKDFSPFTEDALKAYREILGLQTLATHTVQTALDSLRDKNMIWRSARSAYALEDETLAEWFLHGRGGGTS